jgi:hypothetical protein
MRILLHLTVLLLLGFVVSLTCALALYSTINTASRCEALRDAPCTLWGNECKQAYSMT